MQFLIYLSDYILPFTIFYIVGFGVLMKVHVYDCFVKGAKEGIKTVAEILPTLVGLMVGVGTLRSSGFLEMLCDKLGVVSEWIHFPKELIPMAIVRLFSSSAATGLALDVFKEYGTDSYIGLVASIMMGCTETVFYTMSVYYMTAGIRKTRWTLPGALLCTLAGIAASVILAGKM
ncbi:MAG: spore maturation protein [Lachnospiraceae bacterium]